MSEYDNIDVIESVISRARVAQKAYENNASQVNYDNASKAAAWAVMEPTHNLELAKLAVETTGLGNVKDKVLKNHRKTLGLMRDIKNIKTCGIVREDCAKGITEIARPIGVIGSVVPSTNPIATPVNNIINALKCGNSIVVAPSPKGVQSCQLLLKYIHLEFDKVGLSRDLVQMIPGVGSKLKTQRMMELSDKVICTGSQNNVRRAQTCGTPAVAVGTGNVTVIVDETASALEAAKKISLSKTFDNATSCSSENSIIVVDKIFDDFIKALALEGGMLIQDQSVLVRKMWRNGELNRSVIAQDSDKMLKALDLTEKVPKGTKFILVETSGIGSKHPLSGEKLSLVIALYRAKDFSHAAELARKLFSHQGAGHSIGIHTTDHNRPLDLGMSLPTCRVIVNQAHALATGGAFNNGMPFSLSMGCGSWGGNSIDENLNWKHFIQYAKVIREIEYKEPTLDEIFDNYWANFNK